MPTYSYSCEDCNKSFELFFYIKDYQPTPCCVNCNSLKTYRLYIQDVSTQSTSVKKCDSELGTVGDLANRNRDRLTDDQKLDLYVKHNSYKEDFNKDLPSGMSRIEKKPKTKWTEAPIRKKRRIKKHE